MISMNTTTRRCFITVSACTFAIAALLVAILTHQSIALHSDSCGYLRAARSGHFADVPIWQPPLYPWLLLLLAKSGIPAFTVAKIVNAICLAATTLVLAFGLPHITRAARYLTAALFFSSYTVLYNHAWAMSEPLFFVFLFGALVALLKHSSVEEENNTSLLIVGAGLSALALLTRFASISLVPVFLVALLHKHWKRPIRLIRDWAIYGSITLTPLLALSVWNHTRSNSGLGHDLHINELTSHKLGQFRVTILEWFFPYRVFGIIPELAQWSLIVAIVAILAVGTFLAIRRCRSIYPFAVLWGFSAIYLAVVTATILLSDQQVPLDYRLLSPLYIGLLALGVCIADSLLRRPRLGLPVTILILLAVLYFAAFTAYRGVAFARSTFSRGLGYGSKAWASSETLQYVRTHADSFTLFSNAPEAIELLTGIDDVHWIPFKKDMMSRDTNPSYHAQIHELHALASQQKAQVVIFWLKHRSDDDFPDYLPNTVELRQLAGLNIVQKFSDGVVLGIER